MELNMKRTFAVLSLLVPLLCFQSCDFFRRIAGCPTSDYIEAKAARLEAEKNLLSQQQASEDTLVTGSLKTAESATSENVAPAGVPYCIKKSALLDSASKKAVGADFCIMVGSFGKYDNADRLASTVKNAGYPAVLVPLTNGLTAVGVSPTNSLDQASSTMAKLLKESFCPKDAWILDAR